MKLKLKMFLFTGLDDEVIQGAGQDAEDDDDIKGEDESHDDMSFTCK